MEGAMLFLVGSAGSDAPGVWIGPDGKPHVVEGWGAEILNDVRVAVAILELASKFNNPHITDAVTSPVANFVRHELGGFVGDRETIALG